MRTFGMQRFEKAIYAIAVLVVAGVMFIPLAGCDSSGSTTSSDTSSKSFSYAEASDPTAIDPALVDESVGVNITRYLFDGLIAYDSTNGDVEPAVAESWDISEDLTVFTFHLRKGVKFTNGREVTADDFVYAWTRALKPDTQSSMAMTVMEPIKGAGELANGETDKLAGVEAVDGSTLKVTLNYPQAEFVTFLGHPVCSPVPREEVERTDANFSEAPVGNGSFKVKEWKKGESVTLERNPDYYGEKAEVGQVTVKIIPSDATAVAELKAGNVDAVKIIPPGQTEALRNDSSVKFFEGNAAAVRFIGFNLVDAPWKDNVKLRQAINYAIDRETIAGKVLQGQATAADGIVPAGTPGHQDNAMPYDYNQEKARSLLAEAGYPEGQGLPTLTLSYTNEGLSPDIAQAVQAQLKAIGLQAEISGLEGNSFIEQMVSGQLPMFLISWQADYPSVDTFLYPLFSTASIGAQNVFQYSSPEVDKLLEEARSTLDAGKRNGTYNEAERKILTDAPLAPVVFNNDVMIYALRVTKFVHTPRGDLALNEIEVSG